jgi:hypothetical protein
MECREMEKKATAEVDPGRGKRKYSPPSLKKIPLRPQEAVLGFCKTNAFSGVRGATCSTGLGCSLQGS